MNNKTGYALIVVLWLIVILTIIFVNLIEEAQLNSLLLRHNLQQRELKKAAVGGVLRGIDLLQEDKTRADTKTDKWTQTIRYRPYSNLICCVQISDIGSKLNINYASRQDLLRLQQLDWKKTDWNQLADKLVVENNLAAAQAEKKIGMISHLVVLKREFKSSADYQQLEKVFTTYGGFNPNLHDQAAWYKLLFFVQEKLELHTLTPSLITASGAKLTANKHKQVSNNSYTTVPEFLEQVLATNPSLREKIKPYLTVKKQININFTNQAVLQLILSHLDQAQLTTSYSQAAQKIVDYCAQHPIKKLSQLDQIGVGMISQELAPYLTTQSRYLLITATAVNQQTKQEQKVAAVVHKVRAEHDKIKVQIIEWQQK